MAGVLKSARIKKADMDTTRSFDPNQWQMVLSGLNALPRLNALHAAKKKAQQTIASFDTQSTSGDADTVQLKRVSESKKDTAMKILQRYEEKLKRLHDQARRIKALVHLLQSTGPRRQECFSGRLSDITAVLVDRRKNYPLTVTGKGDKKQSVSIPVEVLRLIEAHLPDRKELGFADDYSSQAGRSRIPLISVLGDTVGAWQYELPYGDPGISIATAAIASRKRQYADPSGSLSPAAMRRLVKARFSKCAENALPTAWTRTNSRGRRYIGSGTPSAPP